MQMTPEEHDYELHAIIIETNTIVKNLNCKSHAKKMESISDDLIIIKNLLLGNGKVGTIEKVEKHDTYFKMGAGAIALVSVVFAVLRAFV